MVNKVVVLSMLLLSFFCAKAQEDDPILRQQMIEQRIEVIVENLDDDIQLDYTTLFDELSTYLDRPLNLNKATQQQLQQLYLLSDIQILNLLNHIERFGPLREMYELQAVTGWDLTTIYLIQPFVQVKGGLEASRWTFRDVLKEGNSDLFIRTQRILEEQRGYSEISPEELAENPNRRYLGSPWKLYTRYRFRYRNNLSIGFTAEKDQGEEFFQGTQKNGFDFYSAHFYYEDKGWLRKVAIGDYQAQFGQGLTVWSGLGFGKSPFIASAKRSALGIRPYTAVDENLFFRGAAATLGWGKTELTVFYSDKDIDANIVAVEDTSDTGEGQLLSVSSFQLSGFHRTENELFDKDAIRERHIGGNLAYKDRKFSIGATAMRSEWDADVRRNLQLYNQFEFNSNENLVAGVDYNLVVRNMNFFGEASMSQNGGYAFLNGVLMALDQRLSVVALHRHFSRDYQSLYANAFAERSRPINEQGLYLGFDFQAARKWKLTGYADHFRSPWLSFLVDAPSAGHEYLLQLTHKPSRKNEFYIRWRKRSKDRNNNLIDSPIDQPVPWTQHFFRLHTSYKVHENVQFKTRVEWTGFQLEGGELEQGFLLYQDVVFRKLMAPWNFTFRYALFETDSYNSRLYAYENDVLYFFSVPAYFNRGSRFYAITKIKLARRCDLWLRYAQWVYNDQTTVNAGLEQIDGNTRSEFRAQLRLRF